MNQKIIARETEQALLLEKYNSKGADLISVTGRRRIGKTYLIDQTLAGKIDFKLIGIKGSSQEIQLNSFARIMSKLRGVSVKEATPASWQFAFFDLIDYLETLDQDKKIVLFFDELPWLATPRSGFLDFFGWFWNQWAERQNIMVIICGSAASWMINKVVNHKGGLHNRITQRIELMPFSLNETQRYLQARGFHMSQFDIAELYMVVGGIPYYLNLFQPNRSVPQNIEAVAFGPQASLRSEFTRLYESLFDHPEKHLSIIRALASHHYGLSRKQLLEATGIDNNGGFTKTLEELVHSGFIRPYQFFNKTKRHQRYRLIDEYSAFYLKFIEERTEEGTAIWNNISKTQSYKSWRGYAFENLGIRHLPQIRQALGIGAVSTVTSTFYHQADATTRGLQMDLVIERADRAINLCEFKFTDKVIKLSKDQIAALQRRTQAFRELTQTNHMLFMTLISPYGVSPGTPLGGTVHQMVTLEDLFARERSYF